MVVQKSGWAVNPVGSSFDTAQWGQFSEEQRAKARMDWSSLSNEQLYAMAQSSQEAVRWAASQELFKRRGGRSVFQQGDVLTPESSTWGAFVDAQSPEGGVVNPNFQASYQTGLEGQPSVDPTNVQLGSEQPLGEKIMATTTASQDEATWQSLLQGNIMATSQLTTMPEGMRKVQAASQLAKNLSTRWVKLRMFSTASGRFTRSSSRMRPGLVTISGRGLEILGFSWMRLVS